MLNDALSIRWDRRPCPFAILFAMLALASGCGSPGRPNASAPPSSAEKILVTNWGNNTITAYPAGSNGNVAPIAPNPGLFNPGPIAVDRNNGDIYAINTHTYVVTVYSKGSDGVVSPKRSLALPALGAIGLDAKSRLYAWTSVGVLIYSPGASGTVPPIATLNVANPAPDAMESIAIDFFGNICTQGGGALTIFAAGADANAPPVATISFPPAGASDGGVAFDDSGNLYAAYWGSAITPGIAIYAKNANSYTLSATITNSNIDVIRSVAVDGAGKIYAFDGNQVLVYAPGSTGAAVPIATIASPHLMGDIPGAFVGAMTVDANGQIFVSVMDENQIAAYAPGANGNPQPITAITNPQNGMPGFPFGLAVDVTGNIYVAGSGLTSSAPATTWVEYSAATLGNAHPIATGGDGIPWESCSGLALDSVGNVYLAVSGGRPTSGPPLPTRVVEFAAGSDGIPSSPIAEITGPNSGLENLRLPVSVALDHFDNVLVAYSADGVVGGISKFAAGSNGDPVPIASISGPHTLLASPRGIAVDSSGEIYVVDSGQILIFSREANGDATPTAVVSGPNTGLTYPYAIALGHSGNLFVLTGGPGSPLGFGPLPPPSIVEFAAGSNGNVAPNAVISGPATAMGGPGAIAISP